MLILLIDPHGTRRLSKKFQHALRVFEIELRVRLEVEDDHVASTKSLATRIRKFRRTQNFGDRDPPTLVIRRSAFRFLFNKLLLDLFNTLCCLFVLVLLLVGG